MRRITQVLSFKAPPERENAPTANSEQALRRSEDRFRVLVEAVQDYAIFILDPDGYVSTWNIGAERINIYKPAEIIGRHFSIFYPEEDILAGKPTRALEIAAKEGRLEDEGWRLRKDASRFWASVTITALRDDAGNLMGFAKVTRDVTERMCAHAALEAARKELEQSESSLRELSQHLLRTQDEERRRIGRDLHDSLGQYLAALRMKLAALGRMVGPNAKAVTEITECTHLTDAALKEVRTVSYLLYPPMLEEFGLKSAISWYLEGFSSRSGVKTTLDVSFDMKRLDHDVELALFRVLQESLTNVHRHSGSTTASVRLGMQNDSAILEVRDQGKGIPQSLDHSEQDRICTLGVGMRGMNERLRQLGGRVEVSSSPKGTIVTAIVPIDRLGQSHQT